MFLFFFQAEDGIRDLTVTGVQTCALPIFTGMGSFLIMGVWGLVIAMLVTAFFPSTNSPAVSFAVNAIGVVRSEEHTSELQSQSNLVCRLLLEKKQNTICYQQTSTDPPATC